MKLKDCIHIHGFVFNRLRIKLRLHDLRFEYRSVRCKGDYYKWSRLVFSMWNESRDASTECVAMAPREFRTKAFFHPRLDLSLPVYI